MNRFKCIETTIPDVKLITRKVLADERGFFSRIFCKEALTEFGWHTPIEQINHSFTQKKGTIRGFHIQNSPYQEMKLVSCLHGEVFDIAVDLRRASPTFLQWHGAYLSAENSNALLIPEGFAHGFQSLTDNVELLYCHSQVYQPSAETGITPLDSTLAIKWPLPAVNISDRDLNLPTIATIFPE